MTRVFRNVITIVLPRVLHPFRVIPIEIPLVLGRKPALPTAAAVVARRVSNRCYLFERHIGRNAVACHDLLHMAGIFSDVVLIVLAGIVHPLGVILVEVPLVLWRKSLPLSIGASRILPITGLRILRHRRQSQDTHEHDCPKSNFQFHKKPLPGEYGVQSLFVSDTMRRAYCPCRLALDGYKNNLKNGRIQQLTGAAASDCIQRSLLVTNRA